MHTQKTRLKRRDESGAAVLEFAFIAVVFFTLVFGMVQYSLYFWSTQSSANAAREAARRGAVGQTCADMTTTSRNLIKLAATTPVITRKYYADTDTSFSTPVTAANGKNVRVVVTYNSVDLKFPFLPFFRGGAVRETAVSRVENYSISTPTNWAAC
ncbi:hypothetical protein NOCA2690001 [metagenome]|uniref:TadE-like domain-containing protein n=1 Tax=metagenome TaxID=256318 RepID=A0A2P2CD29_9ZZZZ